MMATVMTTRELATLFGGLLGVFRGIQGAIFSVVFATLFGRKALGKIGGFNMGVVIGCTGMGPLMFGVSRDNNGSYNPAIYAIMVCQALSAVVLFLSPIPDWRHGYPGQEAGRPATRTMQAAPYVELV